ncbi:hypothetical protein GCM10011529_11970 [Polymorphobacter glacialis]|uniref:Reverse transcriptase-like protein n=1 Tax=Sandarakinorhabdus glacialis TaxID=1614636 RepID=A0A916ZPV2_9SPHN|nr:reverse transcriptase-like protein [Polymorphobacter glacialis]GGE07178.1 hypothetical protein GCM10011529_11970 [Polymorphobacter glacialis]
MRRKVFFDGGCRPNPGVMEIAVVAVGKVHVVRDAGHGSSMDAEWLALIQALRIGLELGEFVLMGDAAAVIGQANGEVRCQGRNLVHLEVFRALAAGASPHVRYVKRTQNLAGIALARLHDR